MSAYSDRVIADGASYYWRLGESAGTTAVDSVGGANGTISGGVTLNQPGALATDSNTAMVFDGTTGRIVTAARALVTPFTIEVWLRRNSNTGTPVVFANSWGTADNLAMFATPNALFIYSSGGGPTAAFPYDTAWHQVVVVSVAGVAAKIYIDGTSRTIDDQTPINFTVGNAKPFELGFDPFWDHFNGAIDDVAIYPRALTAPEIAAHYNLASVASSGASRSNFLFWSLLQFGGMSLENYNVWAPITPSNTVDLPKGIADGLWVGGAGDLAVVMENNQVPAVFTAVPAGSWLPLSVKRINSTGTTATGIIALYQS